MRGKVGVDAFSHFEKKLKMCQPIRGQGGHIGFQIGLTSGFRSAKFGVDPCQPIRGQGGHIGFRIHLKGNNTWSGPHKENAWQGWKCFSQSEARTAILDFESA